LPFLDADNVRRRAIAARYDKEFAGLGLDLPRVCAGGEHVYHLYVVALNARDDLLAYLKERGIAAGIHYPVPNHIHPVFRPYAQGSLAITERLARRILSLPIYPELRDGDVDRIVDSIRGYFNERR
jgi:dTDP-4-amino-4,6-dideoxygalactose transaminase